MSEYTAQILVARRLPVDVMGFTQHFKEMPEGPLSEELEVRAALGWSPEQMAEWLMTELDDPEIVVVVEIADDYEGFMVTALVGREREVEEVDGA
ncbi:hypothetical protein [Kozakia baliensis]|uniref:hypothetical protein n=1 Tax=Kozakia baliensis TaxID=153496 RepID=UPI00049853E2|nr:hypothetical protein [Kozakia baliensis]